MNKLLAIILIFYSPFATAQSKYLKTMEYDSALGSPPARLADVAWLAGHWQGEGFGGKIESMWAPPSTGSMMGVFKYVRNEKVGFYEILTIVEVDHTIILRLKHFHADLKGWEEKDNTIDFRLVKMENNRILFDGLTFEKAGENGKNCYVLIQDKNGINETKFTYSRNR
jgi:hypothetical protein